jgi:hypothetical protein
MMGPMMNRYARSALAAATAACFVACDGTLSGSYSGGGLGSDRPEGPDVLAGAGGEPEPASVTGGGEQPAGEAPLDPGRVTLHRLNKVEYNNTIRDLFFGLDVSPADRFPADDQSYGFDNIADVLSVNSVMFELSERAVGEVLDIAYADPELRPDGSPLFPCAFAEAACSRQVIESFARRAWRRPLEEAELGRLVALVAQAEASGLTWRDSVKHAMKAVLVSPHFMFRVELDPDPGSVEPHLLDGFELASRLSYFLWSSMPDQQLFDLAASGALVDPAVVAEQVSRMLTDAKATALAENFMAQWFRTREISPSLTKDPDVYPDFNDELRQSMRTELDLLISKFISERRSFKDLLLAEETFVDDRLAELYGLPAPGTGGFELVSLAGVPRRGILTTGGLMSLLAHPEKTSPVRRGVWVLEQLLCYAPPPPPDGLAIPPIEANPNATAREELAQHRADPVCASCHRAMDPIGLAFEHYDGIGGYREIDDGQPIDTNGNLPDQQTFANVLEMLPLVVEHPDFERCVAEKALTYALGRGLGRSDEHYLDEVATRFSSGAMSIEDLAKNIATSDVFMMRRGERK